MNVDWELHQLKQGQERETRERRNLEYRLDKLERAREAQESARLENRLRDLESELKDIKSILYRCEDTVEQLRPEVGRLTEKVKVWTE